MAAELTGMISSYWPWMIRVGFVKVEIFRTLRNPSFSVIPSPATSTPSFISRGRVVAKPLSIINPAISSEWEKASSIAAATPRERHIIRRGPVCSALASHFFAVSRTIYASPSIEVTVGLPVLLP